MGDGVPGKKNGVQNLLSAFELATPGAKVKSKGKASMAVDATSDTPKRDASSSPVKEKLKKIQRMMQEGPSEFSGSAASDAAAPKPIDPVLDALGAISEKLDRMALKTDLEALTVDLKQHTKVTVAEAVDPIKSEIHDLQNRISVLELRPASAATPSAKPSQEVIKLMNASDPSRKRLVFIGWPDSVDADTRIEKIEGFLAMHLKGMRVHETDNFFKGPYSDRKVTKVAYSEFGSKDAAKRALSKLESVPFKVDGTEIKIKAARTKLNSKRNLSIRTAHDLIKESELSNGKTVKVEWVERHVTVDGIVAFAQNKEETDGTFLAPYTELALP